MTRLPNFDPNAPCSSNQNLKAYSLATNGSENVSLPILKVLTLFNISLTKCLEIILQLSKNIFAWHFCQTYL